MIITQNTYHYECIIETPVIWEEKTESFDELIVSWNAQRPEEGVYLISVAVFQNGWSEYLPYAEWGVNCQKSFKGKFTDKAGSVFQDTVEMEGECATGFRVKVEACKGAKEDGIKALHVSIRKCAASMIYPPAAKTDCLLDVKGISQLSLGEPFAKRVCSPVSLTAAMNFLKKENPIHPIESAARVWDSSFDIFGNWVLNAAHAYAFLGEGWHCWVERLTHFDQLLDQLHRGIPVVVSVKGTLPRTLLPYELGHLLVVIGYDSDRKEVVCMDPAYQKDEETIVKYPLEDFLRVWSARSGLAYMFKRQKDEE